MSLLWVCKTDIESKISLCSPQLCSLHLGDSVESLEGAGDQGQVPAEDVGLGVDQPRDRVVGCGMEQLMNTLHTRDLGVTIDQSEEDQ